MNVTEEGALAALLAAGRRSRSPPPSRARGSAARGKPIVIGWAYDSRATWRRSTSPRSPRPRSRQADQRQGRRQGSAAQDRSPATRRATSRRRPRRARAKLLGAGRDIIFTTCDVDFATPVVQEAINAGMLTIAPCIGTDQMGPKRFGAKGALAFSFGNVAQDEGSAMAQWAWSQGLEDGRRSRPTRCSSTSRTSCRRSRRASSSSAARSSRRRATATGAEQRQQRRQPAERRARPTCT